MLDRASDVPGPSIRIGKGSRIRLVFVEGPSTDYYKIQACVIDFSLHQRNNTGCGCNPVTFAVGNRGCCDGVKQPGREADQSPPSSS